MPSVRCAVAVCFMMVSAVPSFAQTSEPSLVDLMLTTFQQKVVLSPTPGGRGVVAHTAEFIQDPRLAQTEELVANVSQQIGALLSTFPLGSSSGGFTYAFDSSLGTFARTTQTFGPAFAERAATLGKQKLSFAVTYVHQSYDSLDGKDLQNGDIKFQLFHQELIPASYVSGDVVQSALVMDLKSDTTALQFNYGLTDRIDVGLAIPIEHVSMNLTYRATILDFATHTVSPTTHLFDNGSKSQDFSSSGSASGIGDIVLRGKWRFVDRGGQGLAAGLDIRVPSGDEKNMLGAGVTQTKVFLIASGAAGDRVSPHANIGYTFASGGGTAVGDQFNYVGGIEIGASPRITVVADFIGRTFQDMLRLQDATIPHSFKQGDSAPLETTTLSTISETTGSLNSLLGTAGVKINPWRNLLISAHVLFPFNDAGLRSKLTPVVGVDYSF
jgi:Putative MetA-pathway of phenol degradation